MILLSKEEVIKYTAKIIGLFGETEFECAYAQLRTYYFAPQKVYQNLKPGTKDEPARA